MKYDGKREKNEIWWQKRKEWMKLMIIGKKKRNKGRLKKEIKEITICRKKIGRKMQYKVKRRTFLWMNEWTKEEEKKEIQKEVECIGVWIKNARTDENTSWSVG